MFKCSSDNLKIWRVARRRRRCSTRWRRSRRRSGAAGGRRSSTCSAQGERSVEEIAGEISQSVANTSQHLQVLARAGWCGRGVRERGSSTGSPSDRVGGAVGGGARRRGSARRRGERPRRRVPGRAGRGRAGCRPRSSRSGSSATRWLCSTCARSRSTAPGTSPGHARRRSPTLDVAGAEAAAAARDRRLLPRPVLRLRRRRRAAAARARAEGAPAGCRLPGVAASGTAGRDDELRGDRRAAATVPERRRLVRELPVRLHDARASSRVVDPHVDLVDDYLARPRPRSGRRSWRCSRRTCRPTTSPGCRRWSSGPARPPTCPTAPASSSSTSRSLTASVVELGNTLVTAIATPGHAPAHHAYTVADRRRGSEEPWLVFSGDSLLIGDVGRPDLHVAGDAHGQARAAAREPAAAARAARPRRRSIPSHYGGSVCGRGLSGNPISSIGFERAPQPAARARRPGRVRRRARRRHAAAAGRAGADRRRQPLRRGRRRCA